MTSAVDVDTPYVIPEVGVGGYTDGTGNVHVSIASSDSAATIRRDLPPSIAHELDHSSRIRMVPGLGQTLAEAMVREGLADRFAAELYPHVSFPWARALATAQTRTWWACVLCVLFVSCFVVGFWFFGFGVLRWMGYTLGWQIVGRYLAAHHLRAEAAVERPTAAILRGFRP